MTNNTIPLPSGERIKVRGNIVNSKFKVQNSKMKTVKSFEFVLQFCILLFEFLIY
jgi:hypothetical protein